MSRLIELLRSILRPVEYRGPLSIKTTFVPRYTILDADGNVVMVTYDKTWAESCVNCFLREGTE